MKGTIKGTVTTEDGDAMAGLTVTAQGPAGTIHRETDAQGKYLLTAQAGEVKVSVSAPHIWQGPIHSTVMLAAGQTLEVDFALVPRNEKS
jgi:hypothetical protein